MKTAISLPDDLFDAGEALATRLGLSRIFRRPMLIVQSNGFNRSRISTTIAVVMTSNVRLAEAPGNVFIPAEDSGLPKDSVANVSQVVTLDKSALSERAGKLGPRHMRAVNEGLKLVLLG